MNFEALPSNCFNIGKKVKMKVTSAVPLCLLAGMAIVTCGCTAMKLRSEDPAVRMEAVKSYTTVEDWFDIAISDYPEDVRLYAFKQLTCDQEKLDDAICATTIRYYGPSKDSPEINSGLGWHHPSVSLLNNMSEDAIRQIASLASNTAGRKIVPLLLEDTLVYTKEQVAQIILVLLKKDTSSEILKGGGRYKERSYSGDFHGDLRGVLLSSISVIKDKGELVTVLDTLASSGWISILDEKSALTLLERFNDAQLWSCILEATEKGVRGRGEIAKFMVPKLSKLSESLFARIYTSMYESADEATRLVLNTQLTQLYPKSEFALDCLLNGQLDRESARRAMIEANAQKIFDRLQKRATSEGEKEDRRKAIEGFAFVELLNACPEFARKIDPEAAATLLYAEYKAVEHDRVSYRDFDYCVSHDHHGTIPLVAQNYAKLPPRIVTAFLDKGLVECSEWGDNDRRLCPVYVTLLQCEPLQKACERLRGKKSIRNFYAEMDRIVNARELNDAFVEELINTDLAPSAVGLLRLQAALEADTVSAESKAKIQAHIAKLRAEAEANESKARQERLVIEHHYVPMREIDLKVLPVQEGRGVMYTEKEGIVTSFVWTTKQCYNWFEIENDRFLWEFAQKFGLADFKLHARMGENIFGEYVDLSYWQSTTRGKNVEFVYREKDEDETLIMRAIQ